MSTGERKYSARADIGGKEVNINIDLGSSSNPVGPVHLSGDAKIPRNAQYARSQRDMDIETVRNVGSTFADPKQNVHRFGFKEGMQVGDFGSGSGAFTLALANVVGVTGTVYAVDVQRELLTRVQNNAVQAGHENVEIVWGDIEHAGGVGIRDELLDGVLLSNTLFQVDDKITTVKEAWRVLKPNGILGVIDWVDSFGGLGPAQNAVLTQAEATLICTDNGFALKSSFKAGDHHYGLVFIKMIEGQTQEEVLAHSNTREQDFISRTINQELI